MSNVNSLISERLKKNGHTSKMSALAKQSASGNLTSFSGIFSVTELSEHEKNFLAEILRDYSTDKEDFDHDFSSLSIITSEVKAINNQAAILHGERIKKAQSILLRYKEGAFTAWSLAEFYEKLPKPLRPQIEAMPRQAVYTLASRDAPLEKKQSFVESYQGETKTVLLLKIREMFPLAEDDKRRQNEGEITIHQLQRLAASLSRKNIRLSKSQKATINELLDHIKELLL